MPISHFLSENKAVLAALLGALFVSALYGAPHILISRELGAAGETYVPITIFSDMDEAQIYAPRVEEVFGGELFSGDPALREHKGAPSLMPPLGAMVLGLSARVLGGVERAWIGADFIFPAAIFLLAYAIAWRLTRSTAVSFIAALFLILTRDIASLPPFSSLHWFKVWAVHFNPVVDGTVLTRLPFDRLESPEWTFIPLGAFLLLWVFWIQGGGWKRAALAGAGYGLLFYSYPFDWISLSVILGISFLFFCLAKDHAGIRETALLIGMGLLVSVPYWVSFFTVASLSHYQELVARAGLEIGRVVRLSLLPHFILWMALAAVSWRILRFPIRIAAVSLFLGAIAVLNIQLITGYVPQPEHFLRYPLSFTLWVGYILLGVGLWERYGAVARRLRTPLLAIACILLVLVSIRSILLQYAYAKDNASRYTLASEVRKSFEWIRTALARDAVVLTPSVVENTHLLLFTPAKVFVPPTGVTTTASDRELIERFVIAAKLFGATDEYVKSRFDRNTLEHLGDESDTELAVAAHLFHYGLYTTKPDTYFTGHLKLRDMAREREIAEAVLDQWRRDSKTLLRAYAFEYVYVGPEETRLFPFDEKRAPVCLEKVYDESGVRIYKICPNTK